MPYIVTNSDGSLTVNVADSVVDTSTYSLALIGRNVSNYGQYFAQNTIRHLENFASATAPSPSQRLTGQIWFDSSTKKLKFYDGTKFRTTGGAEVSATQPAGLTEGDFWWDTVNEQLYAFNSSSFVLVGPQDAGSLLTQWKSDTINDNTGASRSIIKAIINDEVVMIEDTIWHNGKAYTMNSNEAKLSESDVLETYVI